MSRVVILAPLVLSLLLAACGAGKERQPARSTNAGSHATGQLTDLHSVKQLTSTFNDAAGQPRLVVLMSPT